MYKRIKFFIFICIFSSFSIACDSSGDDDSSSGPTASQYRLVKQAVYDSSDNLTSYYIYGYSTDGKLLTSKRYDGTDSLTSTTTYTYDTEGKRKRGDISGGSNDGCHYTYSYNSDNVLSYYRLVDGSSVIQRKSEFTFNSEGQKTQQTFFDETGTLSSKNTFTYDAEGKRISTSTENYGSDGTTVSSTGTSAYTYDSDGNLSQVTYSDGRKRTFTFEHEKTTYDLFEFGSW